MLSGGVWFITVLNDPMGSGVKGKHQAAATLQDAFHRGLMRDECCTPQSFAYPEKFGGDRPSKALESSYRCFV
ncbi:MAG: hypothetical protein EA411_04045 [Saprospirales bacterium]|nr:MAG: hypothetical protein EA411_04045 [Saprospirales bacterium]